MDSRYNNRNGVPVNLPHTFGNPIGGDSGADRVRWMLYLLSAEQKLKDVDALKQSMATLVANIEEMKKQRGFMGFVRKTVRSVKTFFNG